MGEHGDEVMNERDDGHGVGVEARHSQQVQVIVLHVTERHPALLEHRSQLTLREPKHRQPG